MIIWRGTEAGLKAHLGANKGLKDWADLLLQEALPEVPIAAVQGGFLHDSGKAEVDGPALKAAVSFASPPGKHLAIWVHENMTFQHSVGKSKFLEDPLNATKDQGLAKLAAAIREALL